MSPNSIAPDAVRTFAKEGFVVMSDFLDQPTFEELSTNLDRYIRDIVPGLPPTLAYYEEQGVPASLKALHYIDQHDAYFAEFVQRPVFRSLAEQLLSSDVCLRAAEWFCKPPGHSNVTPPHQDGYYFCLQPDQVVTLWIPIDAIDQENGCLYYVPGSHLRGLRPHRRSSVLGFSQGVADWGPEDQVAAVAVPVKPGDVLAHHSRTIHLADANSSQRLRRAFAIVYASTACVTDEEAKQRYQHSLKELHQEVLNR